LKPCLPSPADHPPSGSNWIYEIKHDGYRLMARRDPRGHSADHPEGQRLDNPFPLVVEAVNHLTVRSCLIDGEVVCCDERGLARFDVLRRRRRFCYGGGRPMKLTMIITTAILATDADRACACGRSVKTGDGD
jgi:ATP-dependent DNA ligase